MLFRLSQNFVKDLDYKGTENLFSAQSCVRTLCNLSLQTVMKKSMDGKVSEEDLPKKAWS